jgi:hypothetical protein
MVSGCPLMTTAPADGVSIVISMLESCCAEAAGVTSAMRLTSIAPAPQRPK